ncbi:hypothetical protein UlMin_033919 [Ulmus minor]
MNRQELLQMQEQKENPNEGVGGLYVKVMTDEQLELLRRQISIYATICEQLADLHKHISARQDLAGMRLGALYCDPLMASGGHKITARQRWTPTPVQLQILERIFEEGNGTPTKQKIKEITGELIQHGQVTETNVYNWFQNRRARSKRKQSVQATNNVEPEGEFPKEKTEQESTQFDENSAPRDDNLFFHQSPDIGTEMLYLDIQSNKEEPMFPSDSSFFQQFGSYDSYAKPM